MTTNLSRSRNSTGRCPIDIQLSGNRRLVLFTIYIIELQKGSTDWISILSNWEQRSGSLRDVPTKCVVKDVSTKVMQLCQWPDDIHIVTMDLDAHIIETQDHREVCRKKLQKDDQQSQHRPLMASRPVFPESVLDPTCKVDICKN